jgi:hypothetical protein
MKQWIVVVRHCGCSDPQPNPPPRQVERQCGPHRRGLPHRRRRPLAREQRRAVERDARCRHVCAQGSHQGCARRGVAATAAAAAAPAAAPAAAADAEAAARPAAAAAAAHPSQPRVPRLGPARPEGHGEGEGLRRRPAGRP